MADTVQCPQCGFEQGEGPECRRCGIIFARMHRPAVTPASSIPLDPGNDSDRPATGRFRRYYRMFRWVSLVAGITVIGLILCDSPPPAVKTSPQQTEQAQVKFREFQSNIRRGRRDRMELDQSELNGWLETNLAIQNSGDSESAGSLERASNKASMDSVLQRYDIDAEEIEKAKSSIRDLQVELLEDSLRLYALFETYGIDLSLEIEARLRVQDGYLRLDPVHGRLGSLPLPSATLRKAVDRLFESPENREKFRLPANIRDIGINRGRLVVSSLENSNSVM